MPWMVHRHLGWLSWRPLSRQGSNKWPHKITVICGRGNAGIQIVSKDSILSAELLIKRHQIQHWPVSMLTFPLLSPPMIAKFCECGEYQNTPWFWNMLNSTPDKSTISLSGGVKPDYLVPHFINTSTTIPSQKIRGQEDLKGHNWRY